MFLSYAIMAEFTRVFRSQNSRYRFSRYLETVFLGLKAAGCHQMTYLRVRVSMCSRRPTYLGSYRRIPLVGSYYFGQFLLVDLPDGTSSNATMHVFQLSRHCRFCHF